MKNVKVLLALSGLVSLAIPVMSGVQAVAAHQSPIRTFPVHPSPTMPRIPLRYLPETEPPAYVSQRVTGDTYVAPPRHLQVTPGGLPQPWRNSTGQYAGSNPFGSAPRRMY